VERQMRFPATQLIIFKGMEKVLNERANGFHGIVEYRLRSNAGKEVVWHLRLAGGNAQARAGIAEKPDLVFRTTLTTFARMAAGQMNPAHAILERKLEVEGDVKTLSQFSALLESR
jgi:putative sterol carrier protein